LVDALKAAHAEFFPDGPAKSQDYARLVSSRHARRITDLLARTQGTIVVGGAAECDVDQRYIPPTIVRDVEKGDSLMSEYASVFLTIRCVCG
jgi:aldehyde dehydrogenase (NAD+)